MKESISDGPVTIIEASDIPDDAIDALRPAYPNVRRIDGGIEIEADDVNLYDIEDVLRPRGIVIQSTHRKQVTLDDVYLHLTGKQLRE